MGIKYDQDKKHYVVTYSRRHPVTRQSRGLRRQGIKSRKEAEKVYKKLIILLADKFNESIHPLRPSVVNSFLKYFANKGMAQNTLINYRSSLQLHTFKKWEGKKINEITTSDISELILNDLSIYSVAHQKSMLKFLRAVFRYAVEEDIIQRDPTPRIKFKVGQKIKKVLKEDEIKQFLREAKSREHPWFPIWAMACYTGMRSGELYALRWENVDLKHKQIVVSESWTKENGFKQTKSGDDRIVEIAEGLIPILENLLRNTESCFVLPRFREWDTGRQATILRAILSELSLPIVRFHDLRASWATLMLSKGVVPIKVMSMGGWKDLKTMQIYVRKAGVNIQGITDGLELL